MTQPRDNAEDIEGREDNAPEQSTRRTVRLQRVDSTQADAVGETTRRSEPPQPPRGTWPSSATARASTAAAAPARASAPSSAPARASAPAPARRTSAAYGSYEQLAILDANGGVRRQHGSDLEFPGKAAYAVRVASLIGEALALGGFVALECRTAERSVFAYRDASGGMVAMAPLAGLDCTELRQQLWL